MKLAVIYLVKVGKHMWSKTWFIWVVGGGLFALAAWLVPGAIAGWQASQNPVVTWWQANGKWLGIGVFGAITIFIAPFLAWKEVYVKLQNTIKELEFDPRFLVHRSALAKAAFELAGNVWTLLDLKGKLDITVEGNLISGIQVTRAGALGIDKVKIDYTYNMQYLEQHLKMDLECPLENLRLTPQSVTLELHGRLNTLADSQAFKLASECPVCKALLGELATNK